MCGDMIHAYTLPLLPRYLPVHLQIYICKFLVFIILPLFFFGLVPPKRRLHLKHVSTCIRRK